MKKIFEGIKDILYDSIDYIIMIGIVGIVVFVIGWRLDLLFAKDALDMPPKNNVIVKEDNPDKPVPSIPEPNNEEADEDPIEIIDKEPEQEVVQAPPVDVKDNVSSSSTMIKVTIPAGSLPSKIGSILEANGLVPSKNEFVQKSQELKLDTKLKSGTFEIKLGSSIEEIVRLIAK